MCTWRVFLLLVLLEGCAREDGGFVVAVAAVAAVAAVVAVVVSVVSPVLGKFIWAGGGGGGALADDDDNGVALLFVKRGFVATHGGWTAAHGGVSASCGGGSKGVVVVVAAAAAACGEALSSSPGVGLLTWLESSHVVATSTTPSTVVSIPAAVAAGMCCGVGVSLAEVVVVVWALVVMDLNSHGGTATASVV